LKSLLSQNAFVSGIDGWTFLDEDETYVLTGSMIGSYTNGSKDYLIKLQKQPYRYFQRPDATHVTMDSNRTFLTGWFSRLMINKQKGNFYLNASLGAISPGFEYNDLGSQWMADRINGHLVLGYRWFEPDEVFRRKSFYIAHYRYYDFEGNNYSNGIYLSGGLQFLNYYGINVNSNINFESYSKTLTRGGPLVINPANYSIVLSGYSDSKEKIIFSPYMMHWKDSYGSYDYTFGIDFEWKPIPQINFTIGPEYSISLEKRQWVGKVSDGFANNTFDFRYLFGELDQNNVSANIRLNWTFTPTMSLQLYLQPFFVVGNYEKFKELIRPKSNEYNIWGDGGSTIIYNRDDDNYNVDPDGNGPIPDFNFNNPDFNFKSFRANIVFRWELLPGSVFYLVWTHDKTNFDNPGKFNFGRDFRNLWRSEANNIFLAKFSYWIDL
jgi:hypothetical protein